MYALEAFGHRSHHFWVAVSANHPRHYMLAAYGVKLKMLRESVELDLPEGATDHEAGAAAIDDAKAWIDENLERLAPELVALEPKR